MAKKDKKEKTVWIDDGRTVVDMSGMGGTRLSRGHGRSHSTDKEKWDTYWAAVKMMIGPMLTVITGLAIAYLIMYAIFFFTY